MPLSLWVVFQGPVLSKAHLHLQQSSQTDIYGYLGYGWQYELK